MKKNTAILILIMISLTSCIARLNLGNTKINEDISSELKTDIQSIIDNLFTSLENKDKEKFKSLLSKELLLATTGNIEKALEYYNDFFNNYSVELDYEYHNTQSIIANAKSPVIVPSGNDKYLIINNALFPTNESYTLFYKTTNAGQQYLLYVYLNNYDGEWLINQINIGNYSFNDLTAPDLYNNILKSKDSNKDGSAMIYSIALGKVVKPIPFLQYHKEKTYQETVKEIIEEANTHYNFPLQISDDFIIYYIDTISTDDIGIIPVIKYVTSVNQNKNELIELVNSNIRTFHSQFPGLKDDFKFIQFRAFSEPPVNNKKEYKCFNTLIEL